MVLRLRLICITFTIDLYYIYDWFVLHLRLINLYYIYGWLICITFTIDLYYIIIGITFTVDFFVLHLRLICITLTAGITFRSNTVGCQNNLLKAIASYYLCTLYVAIFLFIKYLISLFFKNRLHYLPVDCGPKLGLAVVIAKFTNEN